MNPVRFAITAVGFMLCSFVSLAQLSGNLTTVNESGTPQDVFASKDEVFFTAGPTATPCAFSQFANDGQYYFQVTDLSGIDLLSTDPLAERIVTVRGGVLFSYDGHTHETDTVEGVDELTGETVQIPDDGPCGALSVGLAPFADAGDRDAAYLLWLMPVAHFSGDASQVDPACDAGCFHGFWPQASRTHAFRVEDKRFCEDSFCVSGVKFEDENGDGLRDSGESGLPGVVIHVETEDASFLNGVTSPDGGFRICGLSHGGTFRVTEDVPFGYRQTAPLDDRISRRLIASDFGYFVVMCEENFSGLDFGNQLIPNAIGGIKFEDLNANGVRDPGEPGLSGFTINLTPASPGTPPVGIATTDPNGNFIFLDVAPGTYTLSEVIQPGFSLTVPALNSITVTLAAGGSSIANEFGNFRGVLTGTIAGAKFNDLNGNGVRDVGEPGLAGVTITRTASVNDPVGANLSVVTDADGNFTFAAVPFGSFTISETVPTGFVQTFPGLPGTISTNVNFGQRNVTGLLFGNRAVGGTVSGVKFNDVNGNGVRDADETGLAAVTIRLTDASNVVRTTTTDTTGAFLFSNVTAGAYVVSEVVPNGFTQTAPAAPGTFAITVVTGQPVANLLFGNRVSQGPTETGSISGRKILDFDGNGVFDGNDRGFEGIVFELRNPNGTLVATATSDAQGNFTFANVPLGTYVLSEILPQNFFQTFPGSPNSPGTYTITLTTDQRNPTGFLFLNKC